MHPPKGAARAHAAEWGRAEPVPMSVFEMELPSVNPAGSDFEPGLGGGVRSSGGSGYRRSNSSFIER